ncbi:MAG: hypothetical protein K0S12_472 [Bacteroidetes bacterium]|jgi:hypothetical protein|nr:hypothetical protein [Bacteroidota bacterium]
MGAEKIAKQHEENKKWLSDLDFYSDAIKVLQERLEEVVRKNSSKTILAKVEQFQNQLFIQKNTIEIIRHKIRLSEEKLVESAKQNPVAVDHRRMADHADIRDEIRMFEKVFIGLKSELTFSLIKWM